MMRDYEQAACRHFGEGKSVSFAINPVKSPSSHLTDEAGLRLARPELSVHTGTPTNSLSERIHRSSADNAATLLCPVSCFPALTGVLIQPFSSRPTSDAFFQRRPLFVLR